MSVLAFDTLAYVKRLRDAGVEPAHAEAQAEALSIAIKDNVATSAELLDFQAGIEGRFDAVDTKFERLDAKIDQAEERLGARIDQLELRINTRIAESQVTMIKWLVPLLIGQTALIAALVKLF